MNEHEPFISAKTYAEMMELLKQYEQKANIGKVVDTMPVEKEVDE